MAENALSKLDKISDVVLDAAAEYINSRDVGVFVPAETWNHVMSRKTRTSGRGGVVARRRVTSKLSEQRKQCRAAVLDLLTERGMVDSRTGLAELTALGYSPTMVYDTLRIMPTVIKEHSGKPPTAFWRLRNGVDNTDRPGNRRTYKQCTAVEDNIQCTNDTFSKGYCSKHYARVRTYGDVRGRPADWPKRKY